MLSDSISKLKNYSKPELFLNPLTRTSRKSEVRNLKQYLNSNFQMFKTFPWKNKKTDCVDLNFRHLILALFRISILEFRVLRSNLPVVPLKNLCQKNKDSTLKPLNQMLQHSQHILGLLELRSDFKSLYQFFRGVFVLLLVGQ